MDTFDKNVNTLVAGLPSQLASQIEQLPLPLPDSQVMTIDLGYTDVSTAASPPYDDSDTALNGTTPGLSDTGGTSPLDSGAGASTFSPGTAGTPGSPGSGGTAAGAVDGGGPGGLAAVDTAPVGLFKGIGAGLIVLGLALAGLVVFALLRADKAVGILTAAVRAVRRHGDDAVTRTTGRTGPAAPTAATHTGEEGDTP